MARRKKTKGRMKPQYVRSKKRKGGSSSLWRRTLSVVLLLVFIGAIIWGIKTGFEWMGCKLYSENPRFEIQHLVISCDGKLTEKYIRETSELR